MNTIHAVFEKAVFRPTMPVELPELCEVEFEPRLVDRPARQQELDGVYAVLSERYSTGERDVAARHDEHQP